jgi:hypothetical protein
VNTRTGKQVQRKRRAVVGDRLGSWTIVELLEDGPTMHARRWIIECACGYRARKYECDFRAHALTQCAQCANGKRAKE